MNEAERHTLDDALATITMQARTIADLQKTVARLEQLLEEARLAAPAGDAQDVVDALRKVVAP